MSTERVKAARMTESGAKLIVWATAASCAGFLLALPRPTTPRGTPALVLDRAAVAQVERRDRQLARRYQGEVGQMFAQTDGSRPAQTDLEKIHTLYLDWGAAEAGGGGSHSVSRSAAMRAAVSAVLAHEGEDAIRALRASLLLRLPQALSGTDDEELDAALLGAFPRMLVRYGLTREGRVVGPDFVVRVLYAARFNVMLGLPATQDFTGVESRAYWGWLALGARVDPALRMDALDRYEAAGGQHALEARAALLYALGRGIEASSLYEEAYRRTGNLRLRNHAMAASLLAP
ncbi:MAG: hypothetical protein GXP55_04610 [Deltaproteobacteria bacterium]|nr:hypothetical protein [Deltaproteobacteria bacterium]